MAGQALSRRTARTVGTTARNHKKGAPIVRATATVGCHPIGPINGIDHHLAVQAACAATAAAVVTAALRVETAFGAVAGFGAGVMAGITGRLRRIRRTVPIKRSGLAAPHR